MGNQEKWFGKMADNEIFNTKTMAKIHADQRNFKKAIEIYHYLLGKEPGRSDIIDALADLERLRVRKKVEDLVPLIEMWIILVLKHRRIC
jgi:hypothetical protein